MKITKQYLRKLINEQLEENEVFLSGERGEVRRFQNYLKDAKKILSVKSVRGPASEQTHKRVIQNSFAMIEKLFAEATKDKQGVTIKGKDWNWEKGKAEQPIGEDSPGDLITRNLVTLLSYSTKRSFEPREDDEENMNLFFEAHEAIRNLILLTLHSSASHYSKQPVYSDPDAPKKFIDKVSYPDSDSER